MKTLFLQVKIVVFLFNTFYDIFKMKMQANVDILKLLKFFKNEIGYIFSDIFQTYLITSHNIRNTNVKYHFDYETRIIVGLNTAVITLKH